MGIAGIDIDQRELPRLDPVSGPDASTESGRGPESGGGRAGGFLFELVETLVLTVVIFLGVQAFVAQPFKVEGSSMEPTLLGSQYVLIDKLTPRWSAYQPGDIVVLTPPPGVEAGTTPFIKRVIAVAGDRVELREGAVFVNGSRLTEPYVATDDGVREQTDTRGQETAWTIPPGDVFVLGDHRQVSEDSRAFGPVPTGSILGRAFLRYWPLDTFEVIAR
jgi:signal peptidase I